MPTPRNRARQFGSNNKLKSFMDALAGSEASKSAGTKIEPTDFETSSGSVSLPVQTMAGKRPGILKNFFTGGQAGSMYDATAMALESEKAKLGQQIKLGDMNRTQGMQDKFTERGLMESGQVKQARLGKDLEMEMYRDKKKIDSEKENREAAELAKAVLDTDTYNLATDDQRIAAGREAMARKRAADIRQSELQNKQTKGVVKTQQSALETATQSREFAKAEEARKQAAEARTTTTFNSTSQRAGRDIGNVGGLYFTQGPMAKAGFDVTDLTPPVAASEKSSFDAAGNPVTTRTPSQAGRLVPLALPEDIGGVEELLRPVKPQPKKVIGAPISNNEPVPAGWIPATLEAGKQTGSQLLDSFSPDNPLSPASIYNRTVGELLRRSYYGR